MNNMAELITVAKYWSAGPTRGWIVLRLQQRGPEPGHLGAAGDGGQSRASTRARTSPTCRYSQFAELIGLKGIFVDDPEGSGSAWDEALAADRPVVLEVKTDPEIAPLPPHISLKEAKNSCSRWPGTRTPAT